MDDVVELNLSKPIEVTNTSFIRESVKERMRAEGLAGPAVELMRFHVFIHCVSGSGQHMVDFEDHAMTPGTAIWIRPGQVQRWSNTHDDFEAEVAVFASSSIPDLPLFDRFLGRTAITQLGEDADRMKQQMQWMADDLRATQDRAMAAAVVGVILRLFARHAQNQGNDSVGIALTEAFVDSVEQNLHERSVAWHARNIGASTRSVARATGDTLNQRPKEIIDARVILEAQRRLAWSDEDIATIARALRFSEPSNFTKFFRARTGESPSAFRDVINALGATTSKA